MRASKWMIAGVAAAAVTGGTVFCQTEDILEIKLFRPRLDLSADTFPSRQFVDNPQEYGASSGRMDFNFPLGATHIRPKQRVVAYQFLGLANFAASSPEITTLNDDRRLYTGSLAFMNLMIGRSDNLYAAIIGASIAEDDKTIDSPSAHFWGGWLGTHRFGPKSTLIYGGAFAYTFGRGIVLPIIGGIWRLGEKWSLTALAPFNIVGDYKASDRVNVRIRTGPTGNRYRFSNEGQSEFAGEPDLVYLQIVQWRTTGEIEWKASNAVSLLAQAGTISTIKFALSADADGKDPFFDDKTKAAPYARVAARFLFGKSLLEQWK